MTSKKKGQKIDWSDFQKIYGTERSQFDHLPSAPRPNDFGDRASDTRYDPRARRQDKEDRENVVSRADSSSTWRSGKVMRPSGGSNNSNITNNEHHDRANESKAWRSTTNPSSSISRNVSDENTRHEWRRSSGSSSMIGSGGSGADRVSSGRPRLALKKPCAQRLAAAAEQMAEAKLKLEQKETSSLSTLAPNRQSSTSSRPDPFGDAKPVETKLTKHNVKPLSRVSSGGSNTDSGDSTFNDTKARSNDQITSSCESGDAPRLDPFGNAKPVQTQALEQKETPTSLTSNTEPNNDESVDMIDGSQPITSANSVKTTSSKNDKNMDATSTNSTSTAKYAPPGRRNRENLPSSSDCFSRNPMSPPVTTNSRFARPITLSSSSHASSPPPVFESSRFARPTPSEPSASSFREPSPPPVFESSRFARPTPSEPSASSFREPSPPPVFESSRFARPSASVTSSSSGSTSTPPVVDSDRFARPSSPKSSLSSDLGSSAPAVVPFASERALAMRAAMSSSVKLAKTSADESSSIPRPKAQQAELKPISIKAQKRSTSFVASQIDVLSLTTKKSEPETINKIPVKKPVISPLQLAITNITSVSADELADSITSLDLSNEPLLDSLAQVLSLSIEENLVALKSVVSLTPEKYLPSLLKNIFMRLLKSDSSCKLCDIVAISNIDVVAALGYSELPRDQIVEKLTEFNLQAFAPAFDISADISQAFEAHAEPEALLSLIKEHYDQSSNVPESLCRCVSLHVFTRCLANNSFSIDIFTLHEPLLCYVSSQSIAAQVQMLFGVQAAWWSCGREISRVGKKMFQILADKKLVSLASLVNWKDDKLDTTEGKKKILFQVGGLIGDMEMAEMEESDDENYSDVEDGMEADFPSANRNHEY